MKSWAAIARMGGVGDNLIASSVLHGLKKKYGKVEVLTSAPQHVVFENNPHIDKLTILPPGVPVWGNGIDWQLWFYQRGQEYSFFANLSHSCESLRAYLKTQTEFWWPIDYRRKIAAKSYLETVHDICGLDYNCISPAFYPTKQEKQQALKTKKKMGGIVIGWVLGGTRIDKVYPGAEIAIARLIKELSASVVMLGAPGRDFEFAKAIQTDVQKHNGSDAGLFLALSNNLEKPNWPLRRILTQVQACDLVIGPDTGPMWAVAMCPMPKILLLSHAGIDNITKHWINTTTLHADPVRVPCWPCHRLHDDPSTCKPNESKTGPACLGDINVESLVTAVKNALGERHG